MCPRRKTTGNLGLQTPDRATLVREIFFFSITYHFGQTCFVLPGSDMGHLYSNMYFKG